MKKRAKDVPAYIDAAPRAVRPRLRELRSAIRKAAPQALEKISYGMPYYAHQGRLAYFGLHRLHIGFYLPGGIVARYQKELKGHYAKGATVRFPLDKKIPSALVAKLVRARLRQNAAKR
jgi:uncharacterized protein YdhG (YjbR/CyaY superfamily)